MEQNPEDAWFYTQAGARIGPVSFSDLQNIVASNALDPMTDLVWNKSMPNWKPLGEMLSTFQSAASQPAADAPAKSPAPVQTASPAPSRPTAPAAAQISPAFEPVPEVIPKNRHSVKTWPGARRRTFLLVSLLFPITWAFVFSLLSEILKPSLSESMIPIMALVGSLVPLWVMISIHLMRLRNLGMSLWWFFGGFIPFLNLWLGYRYFACPAGYADHEELDKAGVTLAIIYWLCVAIVFLMIIAAVLLGFGIASNPDLQNDLKHIIESLSTQFTNRTSTP